MKRAFHMAMSFLLALAAVMAARADDFWKHKPPADWTFEEALQILRNSPWAKQETIVAPPKPCDPTEELDRFGNCRTRRGPFSPNSGRGRGAPFPQRNFSIFLVRWDSAPEVAAAFARLEELGEHASALFQSPPPRRPPDRYVITLNVAQPAEDLGDAFAVRENPKDKNPVRLKTSRGTFTPVETEHSGVGANEALHFFFPREQDGRPILDPAGDTAEFVFVGKKATVKTKFSLGKEMLP
jgi:hypothetical protein